MLQVTPRMQPALEGLTVARGSDRRGREYRARLRDTNRQPTVFMTFHN